MTFQFLQLLNEKKEKKPEKKKIVFIETDPQYEFPADTMSALKKEINKSAKDLEKNWRSAVELVDAAFAELEVPKPLAYLKNRWKQYIELIAVAVKALREARGQHASWSQTV
ncbi:hypothetical protein Xoosp13_209 [Xanthomonas phage Xoo-sp13]|nr:hypothetical protein Xoosp13_209 [Xanthomonas phage Xoo-sp13]